jgi:endonuclease YncB( thermonuclease family)
MRIIIALFILLSYPLVSNAEKVFGHVINVASGDKLTILDTSNVIYSVRLAGIDAPETIQPFGKESRNELLGMVYDKEVIVESIKSKRPQILIGRVIINKTDINLYQINHGMAWVSKNYKVELSDQDQQTYTVAELRAKHNKIGLWKDKCPISPWVFREKCCPKQNEL